ncbi:phage tail protein I [Pseudaestuariivita sp.]|uniref:phage tail protein I n=1 Tax=Pseudaestuariivita sp. TaxID=2211669 RepID=UPI004057FE4A
MSDRPSILKPNATRHDIAIERGMMAGDPDLSAIAELMRPETCPAHLLGWLAWAFSVDVWDAAWTTETKRTVLRDTISVHRRKGTIGAVRRALQSIGFTTDISEWFETGGDPHTFRVETYGENVFGAGLQVDARLLSTITRLIGNVKPVRSHFTLRVGEAFRSDVYMRAKSRHAHVHKLNLDPSPRTHLASAAMFLRARSKARLVNRLAHKPAPSVARTSAIVFVRSASAQRCISRITHNFPVKEGAAYVV